MSLGGLGDEVKVLVLRRVVDAGHGEDGKAWDVGGGGVRAVVVDLSLLSCCSYT